MWIAGFLQFSLFSVFVNNDGVFFQIFLPNAFHGFSGFAKAV